MAWSVTSYNMAIDFCRERSSVVSISVFFVFYLFHIPSVISYIVV